ncbi:MAG: histidinol dehydrogenase, partial [Acidimicrobiia bacterium]
MQYLKEPIPTPEEVTREVADTVSHIISEVEREGTTAVRRHSARLDGWDPPSFRVGPDEIEAAYRQMDPIVEESGRFLIDQVTNFARLQRETLVDFETETLPGVFLGQRHIPVASVGAYSPGGRYP